MVRGIVVLLTFGFSRLDSPIGVIFDYCDSWIEKRRNREKYNKNSEHVPFQ